MRYTIGKNPVCVVEQCNLRHPTHGYCTFAHNVEGTHPLSCEYGRFAYIVNDVLGDLGEWKFREYADGLIKATLRGRNGAVEVWGGFSCSGWVYFNPRGRDKEPIEITNRWYVGEWRPWCVQPDPPHMELREATEKACAMAGVQQKLAV